MRVATPCQVCAMFVFTCVAAIARWHWVQTAAPTYADDSDPQARGRIESHNARGNCFGDMRWARGVSTYSTGLALLRYGSGGRRSDLFGCGIETQDILLHSTLDPTEAVLTRLAQGLLVLPVVVPYAVTRDDRSRPVRAPSAVNKHGRF